MEVSFLGKCLNGFLDWYFRVSHPRIIPYVQPIDDIGPLQDEGPSDDMSLPPPPPPGMINQQRLQTVRTMLDYR